MDEAELYAKKPTGNRGPTASPERSLIQTQLDRIVNPPPVSFRSMTKWLLKFRDRISYQTEDLEERLDELTISIPTALQGIETDPLFLIPQAWTAEMDRIDRMRGQSLAIRETLRLRGASTWQNFAPCSTELQQAIPELGNDPFAKE